MKRPELHGPPKRGERFGHAIERLERLAEIEVGIGHVRPKRECAFVASHRVLVSLLLLERVAEVVVRVRQVGLERDGALVAGQRFLDAFLVLQDVAEVTVGVRIVRGELDRPPDQGLGVL